MDRRGNKGHTLNRHVDVQSTSPTEVLEWLLRHLKFTLEFQTLSIIFLRDFEYQKCCVDASMEGRGEKRPRPSSSGEKNTRPQKRQYEKLRDARKIAVQSSSPGSSWNLQTDSALASGSVDVNAFTSARAFEINSMQKAMRSSKFVRL
jgi:hypothetical protein